MKMLKDFQPYLVGPVLTGSASKHAEIILHLFADTPELIGLLFEQHNIPTSLCERGIQLRLNEAPYYIAYKFIAGDFPIVAIVLPEKLIKTLLVDGADGKPIKPAKINRVASLMADFEATQPAC